MRLFRWTMLALAGVVGGMMLGEMATGSRSGSGSGEPASYSHLSANPDALVPQGQSAAPCLDCADSYGVAARLRAHPDSHVGDAFRELGAVDVDAPLPPADSADDYRFGGRFPDPAPEPPARGEVAPAAEVTIAAAADGPAPADEAPPLSAQEE